MENIAVDCSWADAQLQQDTLLALHLPPELRIQIIECSGSDYLNSLSLAARIPACTDRLFAYYQPVFVELVARWTSATPSTCRDDVVTLSCLARLLPLAPHLQSLSAEVLRRVNIKDVCQTDALSSSCQWTEEQLITLLLALFRLISFDRKCYEQLIDPNSLSTLFHHSSLPVRYLAILIFCQVMHFAEAYEMKLVQTYIGRSLILGKWESKAIDYQLLKLWEEKRWKELEADLEEKQHLRSAVQTTTIKRLRESHFNSRVAIIGETFIPREQSMQANGGMYVITPNSQASLKAFGETLLDKKPILIAGSAGSGKKSLIKEVARLLGKLGTLITLHLNEQTDAKSLVGLYTSSPSGDGFVWHPGVLTKAVREGRWVLIEDIDRAPAEVLGALRPLVENGTLFIPSRKQTIQAHDGFRLLATIRVSSTGVSSDLSGKLSWLTNERNWKIVRTSPYNNQEIAALISRLFFRLHPLVDTILRVHSRICALFSDEVGFRAAQNRLPSLRDLLKWCRRVDSRVHMHVLDLASQPVPEGFQLDIFKDAVDCYGSHLSDEFLYNKVAASVAQEMNLAPQQMQYHLRAPHHAVMETKQEVNIGRSSLLKLPSRSRIMNRMPFANTSSALRVLESIAAGVASSEAYLLVGETGVGKTSSVQYIANLVGQKLTVVNLSQQSEATDLLGGLKPVTTRSLMLPLVELFGELFDITFPAGNENYKTALSKVLAKQNWTRLLKMWRDAVQSAYQSLERSSTPHITNGTGHPTKKRRVDGARHARLHEKWAQFSDSIDQVRQRVEKGAKSHTFAFVEGRLVQAVRNGEWLLLDEINLAASDTLDHIASLLQEDSDARPFVLLTEAGEVEKIEAHPNFRIFAAMNPATDTGKKDLVQSIRSRFTELYVHAGDQEVDDLVLIIRAYLGNSLTNDNRAAVDLAGAYLEVQKLNKAHKLTDGAEEVPHFSIRSLVRCLLYVAQHHVTHGLRRAIYEGFAMNFFTTLSRASESLVTPVIVSRLFSNVKNVKSFLLQQPKIPVENREYIVFRHHLILKGSITPDFQPHYIRTPSVERNLVNLARAASMRRFPILLQGPTSSGKTSMVEYLAKLSGHKFVRINNHEHTDLQEYLGTYASGADGRLQLRDGVLVDALRQGHWLVLDELNLAPSDVLEALNRLLDDNRELLIPETQEVVHPHQDFMLFATQNPAGLYGGRKRLSRAFRNRFLEIHFDDIPEDELEVILRERSQIAPSFCTQIVAVYKKLSLQRQSSRLFENRNSFATLRDLFRWASRHVDDRQQLGKHGFMLLGERVRDPTERQIVRATIEETLKIKIEDKNLYDLTNIPEEAQAFEGIVWTAAMRRLYVLVAEAIRSREPVLLVGETGCGKTQICQVIAHASAKALNIYNAHTNTETGDLIGSQRPVRSRSQLAKDVVDSLHAVGGSLVNESIDTDGSVDKLIARFNGMDTSALDHKTLARVKASIGAYYSLFVWNDGSLVRSMKAGDHFLLDEISLADDSVLERLNSVLEPSRTILLAEKGSVENVIVARPGFQFFATMNPGGDYGKRELSAALRNRMTEIWVPALSQDEDVLPILEARLGGSHQYLAVPMLKFATWFGSNFRNSTSDGIVLRDLISWCKFVRSVKHLDIEEAFVHGASLVYIDSLGASPAGMITSSMSDVHHARRRSLEYLQTLVSVDVLTVYSRVATLQIRPNALVLDPFELPRDSNDAQLVTDLVFDATTTLKNTFRIVRGLQMDRPVLLEGSPGVGKTAIVTALAAMLGKRFTRINLSDQTDLMDLFGADVPTESQSLGAFSWKDGPLLRAMQEGGWVLLDEMNLASQSVLEGLNSCLDHRKEAYVAELDRTFLCHPDFRLFAAQNPHHQGGGRKGLPASFVNRFTVVYVDPFVEDDLLAICQVQNPGIKLEEMVSVIRSVSMVDQLVAHQAAFGDGGPWEINLRDVNRWLGLSKTFPNIDALYHHHTVLTQRFRNARQQSQVDDVVQAQTSALIPRSLYNRLSPTGFQIGLSTLSRDPVIQPTIARQGVSVHSLSQASSIITAVAQGWPVILAGSSGSGKTQLIRSMAATAGARLIEIPMNSDIDTMDLLGGFEQYDEKRVVEKLKRDILNVVSVNLVRNLINPSLYDRSQLFNLCRTCQDIESTVDGLRESLYSASGHLAEAQVFLQQVNGLVQQRQAGKASFVWNDGVLIDAVECGAWLVLDNANLCNASVLDRLNSLLEPAGKLIISEQHVASGEVRSIKPHPDFRIFLTMDPRHGELSRAMRNRSLEVFMPSRNDVSRPTKAIMYPFASTIARLREVFKTYEESSCSQPSIDNLSHEDLDVLQNQAHGLDLAVLKHRDVFESTIWRNISQSLLDHAYGSSKDSAPCMDLYHPQQPFLNEPLALQNNGHHGNMQISPLIVAWDSVVLLSKLRYDLQMTADRASKLKPYEMTMLERSAISRQGRRVNLSGHTQVWDFLTAMSEALLGFVRDCLGSRSNVELLQAAMPFAQYLRDIRQRSTVKHFDSARFQAYLTAGIDLCASLKKEGHPLVQKLHTALGHFEAFRLTYGRGLQRMWATWKPLTASNLLELDTKLSFEQMVAELESLSMRLTQSRKELTGVKSLILQAASSGWHQSNSRAVVEEIRQSLDILAATTKRRHVLVNYYQSAFDATARILMLEHSYGDSTELKALLGFASEHVLLAAFPASSPTAESLQKLANISGHFDHGARRLAQEVSTRAAKTQGQPLRALARVREESRAITTSICTNASDITSDTLQPIQLHIRSLLMSIVDCHRDLLSPGTSAEQLELSALLQPATFSSVSSESQHLVPIVHDHLRPAAFLLERGSVRDQKYSNALYATGAALIHTSVAALKLMVPDQPFDPALYPQVVWQRYQTARSDILSHIDAHKEFNRELMGQESSMLLRVYESQLAALGEEPSAPTVARPEISSLEKVQEEFMNIIRNVIEMMPIPSPSVDLAAIDTFLSLWPRLRTSVARIVSRLDGMDRTYDDVVVPVKQLLKCFALGAELTDAASASDRSRANISAALEHTPLLGSRPDDVLHWVVSSNSGYQEQIAWLTQYALQRQLASNLGRSPMKRDYVTILDSFFRSWKTRLAEDQLNAEAKSRYYAYRDKEQEEDTQAREIAALFPLDEDLENEDSDAQQDEGNSQSLSVELATLHDHLFARDLSVQETQAQMVEVLVSSHNAIQTFGRSLPAILLQLQRGMQSLEGRAVTHGLNIYTDACIEEARKLFDLAQRIQNRFFEINDRWPEHSVPPEVITFADELLDFKLDFPLAKLLTKAEKILEIISQWQSVASREWSVAVLMDDLTSLIVSWRRMELTTWSRLLDLEDEKNHDSAKAWYFIAYEAVIHNSRRVVEDGEDVYLYCQALARTLEEFLKATNVGQFSPRLRLLETLSKTLSELSSDDGRLGPIVSCTRGVIFHFSRYEANIEKTLQSGRAELEKAVTEQIKLASWKDTNITALRDSARRSHHKLFNIVRKYRALLAQPVTILKGRDVDPTVSLSNAHMALVHVRISTNDIQVAVQACASQVPDWLSRPARLKNPITATMTMRQVYGNTQQSLDVGAELAALRTDLHSSVVDLRKETPSTLTDENAAIVKHLRERKRRLLTDTIRSVAHMGVRRSLATSELDNQSSTAVVLASIPEVPNANSEWTAANDAFHELLDSMPQARTVLAEHSPDLTDGEVRRSVGLLEGLLSVVIKSRRQFSSSSSRLHRLESNVKVLTSMCATSSDVIIGSISEAQITLEERLPWLSLIAEVSCNILSFQAEHSDLDVTTLVQTLKSIASWIRAEVSKLAEMRQTLLLPNGLSGRSVLSWQAKVWQRLQEFGADLEEWSVREPNVSYLLQQLVPWTEQTVPADNQMTGNSRLGAADIDGLTRKTADLVFVALQSLSNVKTKAPTSFKDAGWLMQNDQSLHEVMESLHVAAVSDALGEVMDRLQHLRPEELPLTMSLLKAVAPILEQFYVICQHVQDRQAGVHLETCRLACFLAKSFTAAAIEGFCSPADPKSEQERSGKLESGTGLGEGEGAEDISKDIDADEDMSDFAQSGEKQEEEGEMSDVEDAVDMGGEDLEGEMGEQGQSKERGEDEDGREEESGNDMDEEEGSVDDLDPTAVDEKMWDEATKEAEGREREMKSQQQKGRKGEDQTERQDGKAKGENEREIEEGDANDEEIKDEDVGVGKAEAENADPHLEDEKALELPDEMQLNGEEEAAEEEISDDGMDELSDIEQPKGKSEEVQEVSEPDREEEKPLDGDDQPDIPESEDDDAIGRAQEEDILEEQVESQGERDLAERDGEKGQEHDEQAGAEAGRADQLQADVDSNNNNEGKNEAQQVENDKKPEGGNAANEQEQGQSGRGTVERGTGRDDKGEPPQDQALRRLADALEQFHQRREILDQSADRQDGRFDDDVNMAEADFEHVEDDDDGDAEALGAAGADQAQNLDPSKAIRDDDMPIEDDLPMPDVQDQEQEDIVTDRLNRLQASSLSERREDGSYVPDQPSRHQIYDVKLDHESEADVDDTTASVRDLELGNWEQPPSSPTSSASATELWSYCSSQVHMFSLMLTEQLRLILSPTTATKMRGDFRTGKRLNIKRIIPYIASGYRRDKIWMRRSVPSKRNYQVLLAVDDSKSMSESGADSLALQTTALLCKSLSMLEAGEIAVIGFGEEPRVTVAHDFGKPWTNESGINVFKQFGFQQKGTNVRSMVRQSLHMLRDARLKSTASNASELWQLQLIISDGHCSDHEGITRLVRQAKQERVVMVFVIVDNAQPAAEGRIAESILDLKEAVFEPDHREGKEGEMRVVTRRYLENFPFEYYLVVRDVRDLPGVLSRCLKGWMGSVVDA